MNIKLFSINEKGNWIVLITVDEDTQFQQEILSPEENKNKVTYLQNYLVDFKQEWDKQNKVKEIASIDVSI